MPQAPPCGVRPHDADPRGAAAAAHLWWARCFPAGGAWAPVISSLGWSRVRVYPSAGW